MADMNYFQLQDPRLALSQQLLAEGTSTAPIQHWAQGLSRLAQALVGSKLRDQSQADQQAAQDAFLNAGGDVNSVLANLQGMKGNPYAGNMASQLMMQRMADQTAQNKALREMQAKLQMEPMIAAARAQATLPYDLQKAQAMAGIQNSNRVPVAGRDVPLSPEVMAQQLELARQRGEMVAQNKPMTEGQAKAATYADRMAAANERIKKYEDVLSSPRQEVLGNVPLLGNFLVSDEFQAGKQAVTDLATAQARQESGANIPVAELRTFFQQYAPQPGDSPLVLEQKRVARETILQGMARQAGPQYQPQAPMPMVAPIAAQQPTAQPARRAFNPATGRIE